jgi:MFS family permease
MNEKDASLRENLRALPRGAWLLFFGLFLNKMGTFVLPFLTLYLADLGFSNGHAGLAIGAFGVGTLVSCVVGGYLADRLGRRPTIVLSMVSVGVAMLALSQAQSLFGITLWSGIAGFTGELYRPASSALLADLVPPGLRVTAFAAYRMAINAGWACGPAIGGMLSAHSFVWLFVGDAISSLLFGLVAWLAFPKDKYATSENRENRFLDIVRVVRTDDRLRQVLIASLLVGFVFVQLFASFSLEVTERGFPKSAYGQLVSLNGLLVLLFELPITTITKHWPARRTMALGYALVGLAFGTNELLPVVSLPVLAIILLTVGEIISMPVAAAYVSNLAPADKRGLYMGTYGMTWSLAFVCGPSLGLVLYSFDPGVLWAACTLAGFSAAVWTLREPRSHLPLTQEAVRVEVTGVPQS